MDYAMLTKQTAADLLATREHFTARELVAHAIWISRDRARECLAELVAAGWLEEQRPKHSSGVVYAATELGAQWFAELRRGRDASG